MTPQTTQIESFRFDYSAMCSETYHFSDDDTPDLSDLEGDDDEIDEDDGDGEDDDEIGEDDGDGEDDE